MNIVRYQEQLKALLRDSKKHETLDVEFQFEPLKQTAAFTSFNIVHKTNIPPNKKILFIDVLAPEFLDTYTSYGLDELLTLKQSKNPLIKKIFKKNSVVTFVNNGAKILKNFGKNLQVGYKTPIFIEKDADLRKILANDVFSRRYYRLEKSRLQCKVLKVTQNPEDMVALIEQIKQELIRRNCVLKSIALKTTHSKQKVIKL